MRTQQHQDLREEADWRHGKRQHCATKRGDDGVQAKDQTGFTGNHLVTWVKTEHGEFRPKVWTGHLIQCVFLSINIVDSQ